MKFDVAIVGAGVLGTSLAFHLTRRGLKTVVLEREAFGAAHASGKNAGMIRALYRHPQLSEWVERSVNSWPAEIREKFFVKTGSLIVGRKLPEHHQHLFVEKNFDKFPAVWSQNDGLLDSGPYVNALASLAKEQGAEFQFHTTVSKIFHQGGNWIVLSNNQQRFQASWIVNAAGAWLNDCLADNGAKVSAQAFARHLFVVNGWQKNFMPAEQCGFFWDEAREWYMRLWSAHERLVSICEKIPVSDPNKFLPTAICQEDLADKLLNALPQQAQSLQLGRSWHCFRTYTEDQLPIWGEDPNLSGYFWLAAFGGFGMSTSYAAAEDAARYIAGESVQVSSDFSPLRTQMIQSQVNAIGQ